MNITAFKIFIFDVNGVLINSNTANARAMAEAFTNDPEKQHRIVDLYMQLTGIDRGSKIRCVQDNVMGRPFETGEFEHRWERFRQLSGKAMLNVPRTPTCIELLDVLGSRNATRVALSNTPIEELQRSLAAHDLADRLDIIRGGGDWVKAESLERLMSDYGFEPDDCLLIGDGMGDLNAARRSSISFVAIDPDTGEFDGESGFFGPYASLSRWAGDVLKIKP